VPVGFDIATNSVWSGHNSDMFDYEPRIAQQE